MITLGVFLGIAIAVVVGYQTRDGYPSGENETDWGASCGTALTLVVLLLLTVAVLFAGNEITLRSYAKGKILIEKIPVVTKEIR